MGEGDERRYTVVLVGALLALAALHAWIFAPPAYVDDAYISLHNATVLLSGKPDPSYAGAPALSGATSAPHVVLLALLLLVLPAPWAAWAAGLIGALLYALGVRRLARAFGASGWLAVAAALIAISPASLIYQLFNGLETSLALAGIVWALVATCDPRYRAWLPWILGLLPFLRPELIALSGLLGLHAIHAMWREAPDELVPRFAKFAGQVALSAAPWLILYTINTGSPIPATIGAKRAYFAEGCGPPAWKRGAMLVSFSRAIRELGVWLAAIVLALRTPVGRLLLVFAAVFIAAYYVSFPGALGHYELRYLYVLEPMLIWGVLSTFSDRLPWIRYASRALLAMVAVQALFSVPRAMELSLGVRDFALRDLDGVAEWAEDHLPAEARVMVHDAGYFAYATDFELVDLVGLKTPANARIHREVTLASCGRKRAAAIGRIAEQGGADYFVLLAGWDRAFGIVEGLAREGRRLEMLRDGGRFGYHVLALRGRDSESTPIHGLVFQRTAAFRHRSMKEGELALRRLAMMRGWNMTFTNDPVVFTEQGLSTFDVVVWLNTSGDVLNARQQGAFERYIAAGGGYAGVHGAADTEGDWPWYGELLGTRLVSHPEVQEATVRVETLHPATLRTPDSWSRVDEWYDVAPNPRASGATVLLSVDESSYEGGAMGADHPIAWLREAFGGRVFYTALGHTEDGYSEPAFLSHLAGGIEWAAGREDRREIVRELDGERLTGTWSRMPPMTTKFPFSVTPDRLAMVADSDDNQHLVRDGLSIETDRPHALECDFRINTIAEPSSFAIHLQVSGVDGDARPVDAWSINLDGGEMKHMGFVGGVFHQIGVTPAPWQREGREYRLRLRVHQDGALRYRPNVVSVTVLDGPSVQAQFDVDFSAFPYQPTGDRVRVGANSHGADWTMRDLKVYYLD